MICIPLVPFFANISFKDPHLAQCMEKLFSKLFTQHVCKLIPTFWKFLTLTIEAKKEPKTTQKLKCYYNCFYFILLRNKIIEHFLNVNISFWQLWNLWSLKIILSQNDSKWLTLPIKLWNRNTTQAAVVHLNFRAWSTFPVPVCTVPHRHKAENQQD